MMCRGSPWRKRALLALGHTLLTNVYLLLRKGEGSKGLGGEHFERRDKDRLTRWLVQRLQVLGHTVALEPQEQAA